jgi:hypothetical protein
MKKILATTAIAAMLLASGCSDDNTDSNTDTSKTDKNQEVKSALLDFQLDLKNTINEYDTVLYAFEAAKDKEKDKPSEEELTNSMEEAKTAIDTISEKVQSLSIDGDLSSHKDELESVLSDFASAYEAWGENINITDDKGQDAYSEKFKEAQEKLNSIYEEEDLEPANLTADVTG